MLQMCVDMAPFKLRPSGRTSVRREHARWGNVLQTTLGRNLLFFEEEESQQKACVFVVLGGGGGSSYLILANFYGHC